MPRRMMNCTPQPATRQAAAIVAADERPGRADSRRHDVAMYVFHVRHVPFSCTPFVRRCARRPRRHPNCLMHKENGAAPEFPDVSVSNFPRPPPGLPLLYKSSLTRKITPVVNAGLVEPSRRLCSRFRHCKCGKLVLKWMGFPRRDGQTGRRRPSGSRPRCLSQGESSHENCWSVVGGDGIVGPGRLGRASAVLRRPTRPITAGRVAGVAAPWAAAAGAVGPARALELQ